MKQITWEDFEKVETRVGTIVDVLDFPEARKPAYKIKVDLGEFGILQSSAQITDLYSKKELIGKQVICVINFPEKQIGPLKSQILISGFYKDDDSVVLAVPDKKVSNGSKLE